MNSESDELSISVLEVNRYSSHVFPAFREKICGTVPRRQELDSRLALGTARSLEKSQESPKEKENVDRPERLGLIA
jgi:hypothetical protein